MKRTKTTSKGSAETASTQERSLDRSELESILGGCHGGVGDCCGEACNEMETGLLRSPSRVNTSGLIRSSGWSSSFGGGGGDYGENGK